MGWAVQDDILLGPTRHLGFVAIDLYFDAYIVKTFIQNCKTIFHFTFTQQTYSDLPQDGAYDVDIQ